eukprot:g9045.t1
MESSTEPILDVVRGLSTITSVSIMVTQVKNFYSSFFRSRCPRCRGAGSIICSHCHGTKIRRTYPMLRKVSGRLVEYDDTAIQYPCYHCGSYALNDFDYDREDTEEEAWNIMDNLNAAVANKPRPHKYKPAAGTVVCPNCGGKGIIYRHTPDFEGVFNMNGTWMQQIDRSKPMRTTEFPELDFQMEYPVGKPPERAVVKKKMPNIRGLEGRSIDEVILPYIDDSDSTESSDYDIYVMFNNSLLLVVICTAMSDQGVLRTVVALYIYPIKGCKGIDARRLETTPTGFAFDRQWVIVRQSNHRYITQRNFPRIALIRPELPNSLLSGEIEGQASNMCLNIHLPVARPIQIPLIPQTDLPKKEITVCEWTGLAFDEGDQIAEKLSLFLATPVRLFRFIEKYNPSWNPYTRDGYSREVDPNFAIGYGTKFSDGFPYLIINKTSLHDLNNRIGREFPADRFRPNIIVQGNECWEEDNWREIRIYDPSDENGNESRFVFVKPCKRCKVTTIDQMSAYRDYEPLATLTACHNGLSTGFNAHLPETSQSAFFGWNTVTSKNGWIHIGDNVEVLKEGPWNCTTTSTRTKSSEMRTQKARGRHRRKATRRNSTTLPEAHDASLPATVKEITPPQDSGIDINDVSNGSQCSGESPSSSRKKPRMEEEEEELSTVNKDVSPETESGTDDEEKRVMFLSQYLCISLWRALQSCEIWDSQLVTAFAEGPRAFSQKVSEFAKRVHQKMVEGVQPEAFVKSYLPRIRPTGLYSSCAKILQRAKVQSLVPSLKRKKTEEVEVDESNDYADLLAASKGQYKYRFVMEKPRLIVINGPQKEDDF